MQRGMQGKSEGARPARCWGLTGMSFSAWFSALGRPFFLPSVLSLVAFPANRWGTRRPLPVPEEPLPRRSCRPARGLPWRWAAVPRPWQGRRFPFGRQGQLPRNSAHRHGQMPAEETAASPGVCRPLSFLPSSTRADYKVPSAMRWGTPQQHVKLPSPRPDASAHKGSELPDFTYFTPKSDRPKQYKRSFPRGLYAEAEGSSPNHPSFTPNLPSLQAAAELIRNSGQMRAARGKCHFQKTQAEIWESLINGTGNRSHFVSEQKQPKKHPREGNPRTARRG